MRGQKTGIFWIIVQPNSGKPIRENRRVDLKEYEGISGGRISDWETMWETMLPCRDRDFPEDKNRCSRSNKAEL